MRNRRPNSIKSVQRRLDVEEALSNYPDLPSEKVQDLVKWFKREASAIEVATVAANLAENDVDSYRQFRRAHIDKLTPLEIGITIMFGSFVIVALAVGAAVI